LGRDRLIGVPSTGGDSNVVCQITAFSSQHGFTDGAINKPITTLNQILGLAASGDVFPPMYVRVDGQRAGPPGLRGVYVRLDLVDGAHSRGLRYGGAGPKDADG
jgi:hypothetical protein